MRTLTRLCPPVFLVSALVLVAAAVELRPAMKAVRARLEKRTIALRRPFADFSPAGMPSFVSTPFPVGMGADHFREVGTDEIALVCVEPRGSISPVDWVLLFATYYADPHCQVPHTPDVCYRQTGATVFRMRAVSIDVPGQGGSVLRIPTRALRIDQREGNLFLMYTLSASGQFCDSRGRARWLLNWPGDRCAYFSKIEAVTPCSSDAEEPAAQQRCTQALSEALPVLLREYYPAREDVRGR
ncbi:MAG TPA: hypothetical protein PLP66_04985 [Phycisphaerae bacterium]|nr:hypothetical protein [Phycisphaerae bacterium]